MHHHANRHTTISVACIVLLAVVTGCASRPAPAREPAPASGSDSTIVATTETTIDASIPSGEIDGVVVQTYHATSIPNVEIRAYSLSTKERWQTRTDGVGRFRISGLPRERVLFVFRLIGYVTLQDTIDVHTGVVARIALAENTLTLCACDIPPDVPAVTVLVRDARTTRAPAASVTLRLRDGNFEADTSSSAPTAEPDSVLELSLKPCREGVYSVEVSAPGYKTWRARDVKAAAIGCVNFVPRRVPVWLLPTSR